MFFINKGGWRLISKWYTVFMGFSRKIFLKRPNNAFSPTASVGYGALFFIAVLAVAPSVYAFMTPGYYGTPTYGTPAYGTPYGTPYGYPYPYPGYGYDYTYNYNYTYSYNEMCYCTCSCGSSCDLQSSCWGSGALGRFCAGGGTIQCPCWCSGSCTNKTRSEAGVSPFDGLTSGNSCQDDGHDCTVPGTVNCTGACANQTQETSQIWVNFDGFVGNTTFSWVGRNLRGSCGMTGSGPCTGSIPVSDLGDTADAVSTYSLDSYYGIAPTFTGPTGSISCSAGGPVFRGYVTFGSVHYHVLQAQVTVGGSVGQATWQVEGPSSYSSGFVGATNIYNIPAPSGSNSVKLTVRANAGYMVCVQAGVVPTCTLASNPGGNQIGGSDGVLANFTINGVADHGTAAFGVNIVPAPVPAWGGVTQTGTDNKLYKRGVSFSITNATPNSIAQIMAQKTGGPNEGNPDSGALSAAPAAGAYYAFSCPGTCIASNGTFSGAVPQNIGEAGAVTGRNAIGQWQFKVRVNYNGSQETSTWLPSSSPFVQVYAGTFAVLPAVKNGITADPDTLGPGRETAGTAIPFIWSYTHAAGLADELCGASPCNIGAITSYTQNPLKQAGPHTVTINDPDLALPIPQYPNANIVNWFSRCGNTIGGGTPLAKTLDPVVPQPGCSGTTRSEVAFVPEIINTRIRVKANVNGAPVAGMALPTDTNGTVSGNGAGAVTFPPGGQYTITGPETRTGNTAEGLHWGMSYQ